jgi:hypothetical protein
MKYPPMEFDPSKMTQAQKIQRDIELQNQKLFDK